jgi:hypothetical protein
MAAPHDIDLQTATDKRSPEPDYEPTPVSGMSVKSERRKQRQGRPCHALNPADHSRCYCGGFPNRVSLLRSICSAPLTPDLSTR